MSENMISLTSNSRSISIRTPWNCNYEIMFEHDSDFILAYRKISCNIYDHKRNYTDKWDDRFLHNKV